MLATLRTWLHDLAHRRARPRRPGARRPRRAHARADQRLDLLGRVRRALRQRAHFAGDDREAAALLAGARRLHGRVQREDVGLEGDAVDDADDVDDLLASWRRSRSSYRPRGRPPAAALRHGAAEWPAAWPARGVGVLLARWSSAAPSTTRSAAGWRPAARCAATGPGCRWRSRPSRWRSAGAFAHLPTMLTRLSFMALERPQQLADLVGAVGADARGRSPAATVSAMYDRACGCRR